MGAGSDGKILWVEILDSTGTRNSENVDSALFQCGDSNETSAGNSQKGDGKTVLGDSRMSSGDSKLIKIKSVRNEMNSLNVPFFSFCQ